MSVPSCALAISFAMYSPRPRAIRPAVLDDWGSFFESTTSPYWRGLQLKGYQRSVSVGADTDVYSCVYIVHERARHNFVGSPWRFSRP